MSKKTIKFPFSLAVVFLLITTLLFGSSVSATSLISSNFGFAPQSEKLLQQNNVSTKQIHRSPHRVNGIIGNLIKPSSLNSGFQQPRHRVNASIFNQPKIGTPEKRVLLVQDRRPWGFDANEDILHSYSIPFDMKSSSDLDSINLSDYSVIIVASEQSSNFYTSLSNNQSKLESYVEAGGTLQIQLAHNAWGGGLDEEVWSFFFGTLHYSYSNYNYLVDENHTIFNGVNNPFYGNYANHGYFTNLLPGTAILSVDENGEATTVEVQHGNGFILASAVTLEWSYGGGWAEDFTNLLPNMIKYTYEGGGEVTPVPGTLESITVNQRTINLSPDESTQLAVTAHYSNGTTKDITEVVTYRSSNTNIVQVDGDGTVWANNNGNANLSVIYNEKVDDGENIAVSARVRVSVTE